MSKRLCLRTREFYFRYAALFVCFGLRLCGSLVVLVDNSLKSISESIKGRLDASEELCDKNFLRGNVCKSDYCVLVYNCTVKVACEYLERFDLFSVLLDYLCGSDRIGLTDSDSCHTCKVLLHIAKTNLITSSACDEVGLGDMKQYLTGMTAIANSENDPIAPAKVIKKYADKIDSFQILAGYLDGAVVDKDTVIALADIPSKEVLIAKFLGSIKSPLYGFAYALQAVIDKNNEAAEA